MNLIENSCNKGKTGRAALKIVDFCIVFLEMSSSEIVCTNELNCKSKRLVQTYKQNKQDYC